MPVRSKLTPLDLAILAVLTSEWQRPHALGCTNPQARYRSLRKLCQRGLAASTFTSAVGLKRGRSYRITDAGSRALADVARGQWPERFQYRVGAMQRLLDSAEPDNTPTPG